MEKKRKKKQVKAIKINNPDYKIYVLALIYIEKCRRRGFIHFRVCGKRFCV